MREEVGRVRSKASPKVKALLRTRPLSLLKGTVNAIFHALTLHLDIFDGIQDTYVRDIAFDCQRCVRGHWLRCVAQTSVLGCVLHQIVLGASV